MVIDFRPLQSSKQAEPKEVTDEGMLIEGKLVQPEYLLSVDYQYYML